MTKEEAFEAFWSSHLLHASDRPCSVDGCLRGANTKGLCRSHYRRLLRYGSATAGGRMIGGIVRWLQNEWRRDTDECQISPFPDDGSGYVIFALGGRYYRAHRFACEMFHGAPPSINHDAAHECGNSLCVNKKHITWKTHAENIADKERHGTRLSGSLHPQSKLSEEQVAEIRSLRNKETRAAMAARFSVGVSTIDNVLDGVTWKDNSMKTDERFEVFWASFPNKKGKGDAQKAFKSAIKQTTLERMLEGISRYVANKPDWQAYKYPASWLRGQHWDDEWEPQQPKAPQGTFISSARNAQSREEYLRAERMRSERSFKV